MSVDSLLSSAPLTERKRTMTIVMQIDQLIAPLCYYSNRVLEEGRDDEEASDGREEAG